MFFLSDIDQGKNKDVVQKRLGVCSFFEKKLSENEKKITLVNPGLRYAPY